MLKPSAPMSNTERQRRFRERNPGYYGRLHRKRNGNIKAQLRQQKAAAAARVQAEIKARIEAEAEALAQAKAIIASFQRPPVPVNRMLPAGGPTIDPLASEIAALVEARKATAAVVCER